MVAPKKPKIAEKTLVLKGMNKASDKILEKLFLEEYNIVLNRSQTYNRFNIRMVSTSTNEILISPLSVINPDSEITITYGNREFRQLILNIKEPKQILTININKEDKDRTMRSIAQTYSNLHFSITHSIALLRNSAPTWIYNHPEYSNHSNINRVFLNNIGILDTKDSELLLSKLQDIIKASKFEYKIKQDTFTTLLIGYDIDSRYPFISQLTKPCNSIKEAHDSLMPTEIKKSEFMSKNYIRQGEFFFCRTLDRKTFNMINLQLVTNFNISTYMSTNSTRPHIASYGLIAYESKKHHIYVAGSVHAANHISVGFPANYLFKVYRAREVQSKDKNYD